MEIPERHYVNGARIAPPWPDGTRTATFGLGCFWGAEKKFWGTPGVISTAVGYAGGSTPNPTYSEVCTGRTGHAEVVLVAYDPTKVPYEELVRVFWEDHDPTQAKRQGNDVGTQYRSIILVGNDAERWIAEASRTTYGERLQAAGYDAITTDIVDAASNPFYYAEARHQQYLAKNPRGYALRRARASRMAAATSVVDAAGRSSRTVAAWVSIGLYSPAEPAIVRKSVRTSTMGFRRNA
jgi:peptide-methionine (S)-S-oxide reductase